MKKVKICPNIQCTARVNGPGAMECKACRMQLRNIKVEYFQSDEEIERRLNPPAEASSHEDSVEETKQEPEAETLVVVCSSCGKHVTYHIGLEFCECGEYIADIAPVSEAELQQEDTCGQEEVSGCREEQTCSVSGMQSLDGLCRIAFLEDFMKIGREAKGKEYFLQYGKGKISREHIVIQKINNEWYLLYCKREDRNYAGGRENAVYVNDRKLERDEEYRLQVGDVISMSALDRSDTQAAFFRVE